MKRLLTHLFFSTRYNYVKWCVEHVRYDCKLLARIFPILFFMFPVDTPTTTVATETDSSFPWWGVLIIILALFLIIAAIIIIVYCLGKNRKTAGKDEEQGIINSNYSYTNIYCFQNLVLVTTFYPISYSFLIPYIALVAYFQ